MPASFSLMENFVRLKLIKLRFGFGYRVRVGLNVQARYARIERKDCSHNHKVTQYVAVGTGLRDAFNERKMS